MKREVRPEKAIAPERENHLTRAVANELFLKHSIGDYLMNNPRSCKAEESDCQKGHMAINTFIKAKKMYLARQLYDILTINVLNREKKPFCDAFRDIMSWEFKPSKKDICTLKYLTPIVNPKISKRKRKRKRNARSVRCKGKSDTMSELEALIKKLGTSS